jgi:hypothetical protein
MRSNINFEDKEEKRKKCKKQFIKFLTRSFAWSALKESINLPVAIGCIRIRVS